MRLLAALAALAPLAPADFTGYASLGGAEVTPLPTTSFGTGTGKVFVYRSGSDYFVDFEVTLDSSAAASVTGVEAWNKAGGTGDVKLTALSPTTSSAVWTYDAYGPLTDAEHTDAVKGRFYFRVLGSVPNDTIEGEVHVSTFSSLKGTGGKVNPPTGSLGFAEGWFELNTDTNTLTYDMSAAGLSGPAVAAELHIGAPPINGPLVETLTPTGVDQWAGTTAPLTNPELRAFAHGDLYVVVTTQNFQGGEVRGQLRPGPLNGFSDHVHDSNGGVQLLAITMGPPQAGALYMMLGTASGTSPGLVVDGLTLPLNPDGYLFFLVTHPATGIVSPLIGFLDPGGDAQVIFKVPPQLGLGGATFHHAFLTFDLNTGAADFVSNAVACAVLQ